MISSRNCEGYICSCYHRVYCVAVWVFNDICIGIIIEKLLNITQMLIFGNLLLIVGPDRLDGFYIYITDTFDEQHPKRGHQCYHDQQTGYPNTLQNITCDYPGQYVVIYIERDRPSAILELCEVEVYGKIYHSLFDIVGNLFLNLNMTKENSL